VKIGKLQILCEYMGNQPESTLWAGRSHDQYSIRYPIVLRY